MYIDYLDAIVAYYEAAKSNKTLSDRLARPTPGRIKDECLHVAESRLDRKDLQMLNTFFKTNHERNAMVRMIGKRAATMFKPLANFLIGKTQRPEDFNIELLGWLIDFPQRPYDEANFRNIPTIGESGISTSIVKTTTSEKERDTTPVTIDNQSKSLQGNESMIVTAVPVPQTAEEGDAEFKGADVLIGPAKEKGSSVQKEKGTSAGWIHAVTSRPKITALLAATVAALLLGVYWLAWDPTGDIPDGTRLLSPDTVPISQRAASPVSYIRCSGLTPCTICTNCSSCAWCTSGGKCSVCDSTKKDVSAVLQVQCHAITKKGKQCSRRPQQGSEYCWQHDRILRRTL